MVTPRTGRPRGRPPGAKNRPKTLEALIAAPMPLPPRKTRKQTAGGPWSNMSPEERSELGRSLAAKRVNPNQTPGKPRDLTNAQWDAVLAMARLDAKRIFKIMKDAGQTPDDPRAEEALQKALTALRATSAPKDVASLGRLILDFTKSKPTARVEHTVKTAEDFLDELAEEDANSGE